jgi:hypothetical protein
VIKDFRGILLRFVITMRVLNTKNDPGIGILSRICVERFFDQYILGREFIIFYVERSLRVEERNSKEEAGKDNYFDFLSAPGSANHKKTPRDKCWVAYLFRGVKLVIGISGIARQIIG